MKYHPTIDWASQPLYECKILKIDWLYLEISIQPSLRHPTMVKTDMSDLEKKPSNLWLRQPTVEEKCDFECQILKIDFLSIALSIQPSLRQPTLVQTDMINLEILKVNFFSSVLNHILRCAVCPQCVRSVFAVITHTQNCNFLVCLDLLHRMFLLYLNSLSENWLRI